ncbi:MAG: polysaccharide deacetylase family protein [Patescibacteria group bacterium]
MHFLAINFHYIHEENKYPFEGIYPTTVEGLASQLEEVGRHFNFISQEDLISAVDGKNGLPEKCCLVTFDDGLKSQYENAIPILKKKGIPAVFFIIAMPYKDKKACLVHKIHWLRANLPPEEFLSRIEKNLKLFLGKSISDFIVQKEVATQKYRYDKPGIAKLKFILNNLLPNDSQEKIINNIFKEMVKDEAEFCRYFYMSEEEIQELSRLSFLGIHSYFHRPLSRLTGDELKKEIADNIKVIKNIVGEKTLIKGISYPYGSQKDIPINIDKICELFDLKYGFTMERAFNKTLKNPFFLARMGTNDALRGKYPVFEIKENQINIIGDVTSGRKIYFEET